ncbi:prolyl 3-hydroxylase OGFOD1-like [Oscarella lobularis]|uniref:prolyl 3-hydroxylase OGFOD1-like n=1 Tax=Oscarella lobularis TaxID=121494 RepID=UPI0033134545
MEHNRKRPISSKGQEKAEKLEFSLNEIYDRESFCSGIKEAFTKEKAFSHNSLATLYSYPFPCAVLSNFVAETELLSQLQQEASEQEFHAKSNDLYQFKQTDDLGICNGSGLAAFRTFLTSKCRSWLTNITGIRLSDQVDSTFSEYKYTDTLLCHDDELEGRRIAFIFYLVPEWKDTDGGLLELFDTSADGHPNRIVRTLTPRWNTFVFFEVSPVSFHQVSEILSTTKTRLSINGWFHGAPPKRLPLSQPLAPSPAPPLKTTIDLLFEWVNPKYFDPDIQEPIRDRFEEESSIELREFLQEDKYERLMSALSTAENSCWEEKGPPNLRRLFELSRHSSNPLLRDVETLFKSDVFFYLLTQLTSLDLSDGSCVAEKASEESTVVSQSSSSESNPRCHGTWRRWNHGCYTLIRDSEASKADFCLEASLYFVRNEWKTDYGGFSSYIAKGEDEELLTVLPMANSLALVYRDKETLKFIKYIKALAGANGCEAFHDLFITYYE